MLNQNLIEEQILNCIKTNKEIGEEGEKKFASDLAQIITDAIKSGTVTVAAGITVVTVPSTGMGATTSIGTGTIS